MSISPDYPSRMISSLGETSTPKSVETPSKGSWIKKEEVSLAQRRKLVANQYWDSFVVPEKTPDLSEESMLWRLKDFFVHFSSESEKKQTAMKFDEAISERNLSKFEALFDTLTMDKLYWADETNSIPPGRLTKSRRPLTLQDEQDIKDYIRDIGFSGIVSISDGMKTYRFASQKFEHLNESETSFAIHSVGKLYTRMLVIELFQLGILTDEMLKGPLQLDDQVKKLLPLPVQERLKDVSMFDLIQHKGGIGDYLPKYAEAIDTAIKQHSDTNIPPLSIPRLEELLQYADDKLFPKGKTHYSNLGILLVGLSVQHCFNQTQKTDLPYDEILQKYLLQPAKITNFSAQRPPHACFNETDQVGLRFIGTPAGGYWTTAEDLLKFGMWMDQKGQETGFRKLIDTHFRKLFDVDEDKHVELIQHDGAIESSSAFLQTSLENHFSLAIVSDQEGRTAEKIRIAINENLLWE